jgi:two-component system, NarL family, sensor kinase
MTFFAAMRTIVAIHIFFLLVPFLSWAQNNEIDSMHREAQQASGTRQVELYRDLSYLTRNIDGDTAMYFARKANELANLSDREYDKKLAYLALGRTFIVKGNYDLAIKYFNQVLGLPQTKNDTLTAAALNGIGTSQWQQGKHAEALLNHFKALRIWEQADNYKGIASSDLHIGMVYQTQEKLPLAEKHVKEAVKLLQKNYDPSMEISALHTLANIYGMEGKIKEAFALDKQGIALAEKTKNEFAKALFYDNMGNCYLYGSPPDYKKAIEYFTKTLQIDSAFKNKKQMSDSYVNLGGVFIEQKKYADAIPYLERSAELAQESGFAQGRIKALMQLSTAYKRLGQDNAAYASLQNAMKAKDSFTRTNSEAHMAEMETVYETEKKQQQINLQKEQLSKKNYLLIGIVLLIIFSTLLALSAWLRIRLKQKARFQQELMKQQELATKAVLAAEEKERQRIARDLHDGVGQMMSVAKMNLSAFESDIQFGNKDQQEAFEKIINLVDESCREVRSVSHNMMPNALLKNSLSIAIRDFVDKIEKRSLKIRVYTEGLDDRLDSNLEIVLYRVIQECVNNVIKHANASRLDISVLKDKAGISATIEDNGKGFDIGDKDKFEGIGLKNIITRIEYLKGMVDFDSSPGRGTLVALNVPLEQAN